MNIKLYFFYDYDNIPDINRFYDYFVKENIKLTTTDDEVRFSYFNRDIENKAEFVITKISTVPNLLKLGPKYKDFKFYLEFPLVLSYYHLDQILSIAAGLNAIYPFFYYSEEITAQIEPFDKETIISRIIKHRDEFVMTDELGSVNKQFYIKKDLLSYICEYQSKRQLIIDDFSEKHRMLVNVNPFVAIHKLKHNEHHEIKFATDLNLDVLTIIPENIDYFYVPDPDGDGNSLVQSSIVMRDIDQFLTTFEGLVPGCRIIDFNQVAKAKKKFQKKLARYKKKASDKNDFEVIRLYGLLDR